MTSSHSTVSLHTVPSRTRLEELVKKRFFFAPSFSIYGGVAGLYDYGPPGCALQANILSLWRSHFILEEGMLEVDTTILTPEDVLKTSGHVDRFTDYMVKDEVTGDVYRADHLLKGALQKILSTTSDQDDLYTRCSYDLAQLDGMDGTTLNAKLTEYHVLSDAGNAISKVIQFNLMFGTSVGPVGNCPSFLRPETAQGQFVNFKRLLECNNDRMPFASAQIGRSFRNEISPRSGLLRVREFTMAEIEHYVHPKRKDHPKFDSVKNISLPLLTKSVQLAGGHQVTEMSIGAAVSNGIVDNETLGYFLVRIYQFLIRLGIHADKIRFRQHMHNEMAHYASDCWDGEVYSSYGWIECVGCADRAAYDLSVHSRRTREKLIAREVFDKPVSVTRRRVTIDRKALGMAFRKDAKAIGEYLEALEDVALAQCEACLATDGALSIVIDSSPNPLVVPAPMLTIEKVTENVFMQEYIPNVIEPSFGIGRILYSLLEHSFWVRSGSDSQRAVLSFPALVAPTKCLIAPIMAQDIFLKDVQHIANLLRSVEISTQVDFSGSTLGKKYSRNDEIGIPFAITVDHRSLEDATVTLRERDSTSQIRVPITSIPDLVKNLVFEKVSWSHIVSSYESVLQKEIADLEI